MTVRTTAHVHFGPADIGHHHGPGHATLDIADKIGVLHLHFDSTGLVDAVIAELVALRREMDPPGGGTDGPGPVTDPPHAAMEVSPEQEAWERAQYDPQCGARPYPAGSEGDDGTECALPAGHDGPHDDLGSLAWSDGSRGYVTDIAGIPVRDVFALVAR